MSSKTVIGSSIVIDGEISGDEPLVVHGNVKGQISLNETVFVEPSGTVEANIETKNIEISGQVVGEILASDRAEIKSDGKVVGNIKASRILIADGAVFKGHIDMEF